MSAPRRKLRRGCLLRRPAEKDKRNRAQRPPAPRERRGPSEPTLGNNGASVTWAGGVAVARGRGSGGTGAARARGVRRPEALWPRARGLIRDRAEGREERDAPGRRRGPRGHALGRASSPDSSLTASPFQSPARPPRCRRTHRPHRTAAIPARNCRSRLGARPPRPRRPGTAPSSRPARDRRSVPYPGSAAEAGRGDAPWWVVLPGSVTRLEELPTTEPPALLSSGG